MEVEVTNISHHGFWLLIRDQEKFLPFDLFPWFREASIAQITAVEMPGQGHIYWPQLDIDLCEESIDHPDMFPLISKTDPAIEKTVIG